VVEDFLGMLPASALVGVVGLYAILRDASFARYRPLGVALGVVFAVYALLGERGGEHLVAACPVVLAAGAAKLDPWLRARRWRYPALAALLVIPGGVAAPFALPLLPVARFEAYSRVLGVTSFADLVSPPREADPQDRAEGPLPTRFGGMFGWPELVRTVGMVVTSLPPEEREDAVILASDAGQAGAIDLFGPSLGLPPVISGADDFWLWGPLGASGKVVVAVGGDEALLRAHFRAVDLVTVFGHSLATPPQRRVRIYVCRDANDPLDVMWPDFKAYD
jgi:hypothetical protein